MAAITSAHEPREGEPRTHMWVELTKGEQREASFRGFPRGGDIRYFLRKGYRDGELMLSRWTRMPSPGKPRTADDEAKEA